MRGAESRSLAYALMNDGISPVWGFHYLSAGIPYGELVELVD